MSDVPIVVDLDGTLIATDLLAESATMLFVEDPFAAPRMLSWLRRGKATLKTELTARTEVDVAVLPYRKDVLAWLVEERAAGRQIVLASASDVVVVQAIADHLGLFDGVYGSTPGRNLRSESKRDLLTDLFGERGFDYVGNSSHDLPVWAKARTAHVVSNSSRLRASAAELAPIGRSFAQTRQRSFVGTLVKALRVHQWAKNVLVLVPLILSHRMLEATPLAHGLAAMLSFCLTASSVYILNDLSDINNDRHHPTKRRRPIASGDLSVVAGWALWPLLLVAGFAICLFLPWYFAASLATYYVLTTLYTFVLKRRAVVDVVALALLYTLRIVAGSAAIATQLSNWLLTFSMFLFLGLALTKRVSELTRVRRESGSVAKGRGYVEADLELLSMVGVASSMAAVLTFALFVDDGTTMGLYHSPGALWLSVPVLLAWLLRVWLFAHRGDLDEDPIVFALKDRASLVLGVLVVAFFVFASVVTV